MSSEILTKVQEYISVFNDVYVVVEEEGLL